MRIKHNYKLWQGLVVCCLLFSSSHFLTGCVTVTTKAGALPVYEINGASYVGLAALCDLKGITLDYDTFTRSAALTNGPHRINLMVGDTLVLADGNPVHLKNPVDIYQGIVVVPVKFREQVLDILLKESSIATKAAVRVSKIKKIVLDAGHGGRDPGAIGRSGVREKDINLDIAKRVARLLKSEGIEVIMTRSADTFIPLERRAEIANDSKADLFVSIHSNSSRVRSLDGFEIFYVAPSVSDSKRALASAKEERPDVKNAYFATNDLDVKAIVWDMIYANSRAESIELSRSISRLVRNNLDLKVLGIKPARFQVLRVASMPAVLIEVGFLSNSTEETRLKNGFYRQKMAESITQGIKDYSGDLILTEAR